MMGQQVDPGEDLSRLADDLDSLEFGGHTTILSADRDRLAGMIRSYLVPRVIGQSTPPTVVVAGPTGSGKSTLVNSLAGVDVSPTGALRPTTSGPLVLSSSLWASDYEAIGGVQCQLVTDPSPILDTMVLVDSPDIDSTFTDHHAVAETLIDNADLVVFVTSASRYADEMPWQVLRRAVSRGSPVVHVLNRVSSSGSGAVVDFKARLSAAGLDDDLAIVAEHHLSSTAHRVPRLAVHSLQERLAALLANRSEFAAEVLDRVLRSTLSQVEELVASVEAASEDLHELQARLSVGLPDRVSGLSLAGVCKGILIPPPDPLLRSAVRRWKRAIRRDSAGKEAGEAVIADRLAAAFQSDLRSWLIAGREELRTIGVDPAAVAPELGGMSRSAAGKWIDYVGRVAEETGLRDRWLAELVLIDAATSGSTEPAIALFGADSDTLVDRARRELMNRLETLYEHALSKVVGAVGERQAGLDMSEVRASLDTVTSRHAPVHA